MDRRMRDELKKSLAEKIEHDTVLWSGTSKEEFNKKAGQVGILHYSVDEDARSLKSLILFGLKGIAAYADHAAVLGYFNAESHKG